MPSRLIVFIGGGLLGGVDCLAVLSGENECRNSLTKLSCAKVVTIRGEQTEGLLSSTLTVPARADCW